MKVKSVSSKQNFEGNLIVKKPISVTQNYLFNLHKPALEAKIKDLPFDLFVEQSKSRKTITLSTNVDGANSYFVRKNKQNFEYIADCVIEDAKIKSEQYQKQVKARKMYNLGYAANVNIVAGNFKEARKLEKGLAYCAVEDFEVFKLLPKTVIKGIPLNIAKEAAKNSIKYKIYKLFSPKTQEEKQFAKMRKEYLKELKEKNKKIETVEITFPSFYYYLM